MSILSICALAVVTVIIFAALKPKNAEISAMLSLCACVIIILGVLAKVGEITGTINSIITASGVSADYVLVLLKAVGICLVSEFAANACADCGSRSLAASVSLAGRIMIIVTALPLYSDILAAVVSLVSGGE